MKWFKHDSNSIHEASVEKLIQKYGVEGYGLYYACIELIAQRLAGDNIDFELHHDAETLAVKFKIDTLRVEEIMKFCIKNDLFQFDVTTGKIFCLRLFQMLDVSTSQNPEIKKIASNENYQKLLDSNSRLDKIRLDKIRPDKIKEKKNLSESDNARKNKIISMFNDAYKDIYQEPISFNKKEIGFVLKLISYPENAFNEKFSRLYQLCKKFKTGQWYSMTPTMLYSKWNDLTDKKVKSLLNGGVRPVI